MERSLPSLLGSTVGYLKTYSFRVVAQGTAGASPVSMVATALAA